jgi:hypothetical protein
MIHYQIVDGVAVTIMNKVSRFATDHRERLEGLDVNPIILDTSGAGTAVDVVGRIE